MPIKTYKIVCSLSEDYEYGPVYKLMCDVPM